MRVNTVALHLIIITLAFSCSGYGQEASNTTTTSTNAPKSQDGDVDNTPTSSTSVKSTTDNDLEHPATSTVDSLSVNLDETGTDTAVPTAELPTTTTKLSPSPNTDDEDDSEETGGGIEPKSISGAAPGANSLAGSNSGNAEDQSGKLLSETESNESPPTTNEESVTGSTTKSIKKPHRLNMTLVDQMYLEGHKEEQEIVESWDRMGKSLKRGIGNIIGSIVPFALNMSQEAKISGNCSGAMLKWVLSMNQLKAWSLRMLDATGKPIAGLLEGSLTMFGNYRQCLKIRAPDDDEIEFTGEFKEYFRGKYCVVQAKPWLPEKKRFYSFNTKLKALMDGLEEENPLEKSVFNELSEWALAFNFVNIRMDLCVPSLCSREDIQKAVSFLTRGIDIKARVLRCETDSPDGSFSSLIESGQDLVGPLAVAASTSDPFGVQSEHKFLSYIQLGWLFVPAIAIGLVLAATVCSAAIGNGGQRQGGSGLSSKLSHTVKSLSLKRSVSSHLDVDYDQLADDKPLALYGVRFILVMWVILVESAVNLKFEYLRELLMLKDLIFWWPLQVVINSTLQFDSIILLTAFTMSYKNCLNDGVTTVKTITKFVLDKYIRLMPSVMVMVALVILLPLIYKGPVWNDYVTKQSTVCQSTGWLNMVFLQNYLPYHEICIPQSWLLCVEFQLVLLMAPVVYYLNKHYMIDYRHNISRSRSSSSGSDNNNSNLTSDNNKQQKSDKDEASTTRWTDATRPLYWLRTLPGTFLIACIGIGLGSSFYNVYTNDLPPSWFYTMPDPDSKSAYFSEHLMKLWTHLAVFAIGILGGLECRRVSRNVTRGYKGDNLGLMASGPFNHHRGGLKHHINSHSTSSTSLPYRSTSDSSLSTSKSAKNYNDGYSSASISININTNNNRSDETINRTTLGNGSTNNNGNNGSCSVILDVIGCLVALTTMLLIIFSTHDWSINELPKPLVAGLFDVTSRFMWSMALLWLLYMVCVPNRDGKFSLLARSLGHPAMVFLGKLSFLVYIIHPFVHMTVLAIQEQPIYSSWLMLFHIMIGNLTITVILASLMSLFVEMPCRNLFRRCGRSLLLNPDVDSSSFNGATAAAATADSNSAH